MMEGARSTIERPDSQGQLRGGISRDWPLVSRWMFFAGIRSCAEHSFVRRAEILAAEGRRSECKYGGEDER